MVKNSTTYYLPKKDTPIFTGVVQKRTYMSSRLGRPIVTYRTEEGGSVYLTTKAARRAWKRIERRAMKNSCPECGDTDPRIIVNPNYDPSSPPSYHSMKWERLCRECARGAYKVGIISLSPKARKVLGIVADY